MTEYPLDSTLFFAVSGNPIGFNHLAVAEWLLRLADGPRRVVFVLSNGRHPDPTKPDAEVPPEQRLRLLESAIAEVADPGSSFLAARATQAGERLRAGPETLGVSTLEFAYPRAVRTAETVAQLLESHPGEGPVHLAAGVDLVERMADPVIFSDDDLGFLADHAHYAILERDGLPAAPALQHLRAARGVSLRHRVLAAADAPDWLAPMLALSSTCIRHASEAGDPLEGMLPRATAAEIRRRGHYRAGRTARRLVDPQGREVGSQSVLQATVAGLHAALLDAGHGLLAALRARREAGRAHSLALVETATGGHLTAALASWSGASQVFLQSRFAYDRAAKAALIGREADRLPAVSEDMVAALARAMRAAAGSDFALAESGMAGPPDGRHRSFKNGTCCLALATPEGLHTRTLHRPPFLTRREHQLAFARDALQWALERLEPRG